MVTVPNNFYLFPGPSSLLSQSSMLPEACLPYFHRPQSQQQKYPLQWTVVGGAYPFSPSSNESDFCEASLVHIRSFRLAKAASWHRLKLLPPQKKKWLTPGNYRISWPPTIYYHCSPTPSQGSAFPQNSSLKAIHLGFHSSATHRATHRARVLSGLGCSACPKHISL